MPSSDPTTNDDDVSPEPSTPRKAAGAKKGLIPGAAAPGTRQRSNSKKPEQPPPTLLADFLLGRPSPARIAAERQRRQSVEAVKAELRYEMKQSAVKKVQPPGGVKDRVKAWQKTNAAVVVGDVAVDDAATEPPDAAIKGEDEESVTEEDRVRIKMRQKRNPSRSKPPIVIHKPPPTDSTETGDDARPHSPPKKRVVSDEHWRKTRAGRRSPPRKVSPRTKKSLSPSPTPISLPKDFVIRSGPNPTVSSKIKSWADKVEIPDSPPPRSHRSSKSRERSARFEDDKSEGASDTTSQVTATRPLKSQSGYDDGIRVTPTRNKKTNDDGIRVSAVSSSANDDGIRIRPMSALSTGTETTTQLSSDVTRPRSKTTTEARRSKVAGRVEALQEPTVLSQTTGATTETATDITGEDEASRNEVEEEPDSVLDTPTKRPGSRQRSGGKARPKTYHPGLTKEPADSSWNSDEDSALGTGHQLGSDLTSSLAAKSVADIPGDIPFGHSAFSELDLPLNGVARSRPKQRPKVERNSSLKAMPNVFKKVVEEGKKIIQDMNEPPPRQTGPNKPPSIEKWLNGTVDPFVEPSSSASATPPKPKAVEKEWADKTKTRRRSSHETKATQQPALMTESTDETRARRRSSQETKASRQPTQLSESTWKTESTEDQENTAPVTEGSEAKTKSDSPKSAKTPPSSGLKRSQATRGSSSPWKTKGKLPFLEVLKEAFQGESSGPSHPLNSYQSQEPRRFEDDLDSLDDQTMLTGSGLSSEPEDSYVEPAPKMAGPRLRPPTNGHHELSTILSEEDSSVVDSDMTSDLSHSTLTQSTILTKDSELSKSQNAGPGLKRRLTKHSDLVSVLSLPDDSNIPKGITSNRSRPSLRKNRGTADDVTVDDLLKEFIDDENLYLRELKTLVDGVVPVLLSQVVGGSNASDLFGSRPADNKADAVSKSVVSMGVALEKLRNAHKKAPGTDLRRLAHWAHGVVPIYSSYLSAWRLGFQDLVVNLAPAAEGPDDEDSLLNALPRNERGDIINDDGERVDVAHLLKRPLLRVKQLVKFIKCMDMIIASNDTNDLLRDFENLQDKARRRHREETARMADEDAFNTDTTRSRDLRTLAAMESVTINSSLQVNAKDVFSLDLAHSNGQRLECQVEVVHRDDQRHPEDEGDVLIREVGDGRRSYLLFPPFPVSTMSARTGEGNFDMVVMIRGTYKGRQWHELLTLTADNEDQILDWLDILPLNPVPPREPEPSVVGDLDDLPSQKRRSDIPVGARNLHLQSPRSPRSSQSPNVEIIPPESPTTPTKRPLPSRYHPRGSTLPSTLPPAPAPASPDSPASDRTTTQDDYGRQEQEERTRPLRDDMRPDPSKLQSVTPDTAPYRDDGAPPPPAHRTLSPSPQQERNSVPSLSPPKTERKKSSRVKRRTSSPLKHEYLPSDVSSVSEASLSDGSESDSSDDEIESVDIPETELGVSIQDELPPPMESLVSESLVSASECSLTPSNSASQAGMHGHKTAPNENATRYMASISRWSEKGVWKDVSGPPCSIIVTAGLIEAYPLKDSNAAPGDTRPLVALDLTPIVLIRQSTAVDLEIRSSVQTHCQLSQAHGGGNFRFRCHNAPECFSLYMAVHHARLQNQKFIQLENEARFKGFGERQAPAENDGDSSSRRRSWFGRKNSYRSSVRAPSHDGASTTPSSSLSATSFLKRLTVGGNLSFNIARSSVDKQSRGGSGGNSLYTSGSSSAGGTPPRSPSISVGNSSRNAATTNTENIRIRLHLLVSAAKWEDFGNCSLQIRRPPPGWHQALRADHGLEKRVTVTTLPKKDSEKARIVLDAVLGSGCFTPMGNRGIVCGVWEDAKGMEGTDGVEGIVPATGPTGGNIKKWCFQFASAPDANWVLRMVHQEVLRA